MKKLLFALLLLGCSLPAIAGCTFPPQSIASGHNVSCALPSLTAGQCVEYRFHWSETGTVSTMSVNVKLNTSAVYPDVSYTDGGNYELSGRFCADSGLASEYYFNSPTFEYQLSPETFFILEGSTYGTAAEDVSVASTLTFNVVGGRGWAAYLNGGTVSW